MKNPAWWVAGLMFALVIVQETRIQSLKNQGAGSEPAATPAGQRSPASSPAPEGGRPDPASPRLAERGSPEPPPAPADREASEMGRTLRQMSENPVGQAMMSQGVKAMASVLYQDLIDEFALSDEEAGYFLDLQASMFARQQQLSMQMMGAGDAAERESIIGEIETMKDEHNEAVKTFLNHDEDFARYEAFEKRLPERQQLDGIRSSMEAAGAPLEAGQEDALVEAMYEARHAQSSGSSATDWNGTEGIEAIARGDAQQRFEQEWENNSRRTLEGAGEVLDAGQLAAFEAYLEQMKEVQLMGLKMAERMFQPDPADGGE